MSFPWAAHFWSLEGDIPEYMIRHPHLIVPPCPSCAYEARIRSEKIQQCYPGFPQWENHKCMKYIPPGDIKTKDPSGRALSPPLTYPPCGPCGLKYADHCNRADDGCAHRHKPASLQPCEQCRNADPTTEKCTPGTVDSCIRKKFPGEWYLKSLLELEMRDYHYYRCDSCLEQGYRDFCRFQNNQACENRGRRQRERDYRRLLVSLDEHTPNWDICDFCRRQGFMSGCHDSDENCENHFLQKRRRRIDQTLLKYAEQRRDDSSRSASVVG